MLKALLVEKFHITLAEYGRLTPREVQEVYLHPRTSDGDLKPAAPSKRRPPDKLATYHRFAALLELQNKNHPKLPELRRRIKELEDGNANRKSADGDSG